MTKKYSHDQFTYDIFPFVNKLLQSEHPEFLKKRIKKEDLTHGISFHISMPPAFYIGGFAQQINALLTVKFNEFIPDHEAWEKVK